MADTDTDTSAEGFGGIGRARVKNPGKKAAMTPEGQHKHNLDGTQFNAGQLATQAAERKKRMGE